MAKINIDIKYNCDNCQEARRLALDCDNTLSKPNFVPLIPDIPWMVLYRCPRAIIAESSSAMVLWDDYMTWRVMKTLPYEGGLFNQPSKYVETIEFLEGLVEKIQHDKFYIKYMENKAKEQQIDEPSKADKKITSFSQVSKSR